MNIETKFSVGQEVCLFNSVTQEIEHDEVFAIMVGPSPVKGDEGIDPTQPVSVGLKKGILAVGWHYQLQHHQGLLDEKILFSSEEELKAFYREFFL